MKLTPSFTYYGTSEFSTPILQGLLKAGLKSNLIVSTIAKPAGRGLKTSPTPVAQIAKELNLPLLEVKTLKDKEIQKQLTLSATPFAILAAFGKIIPPEILELYPKGIINVHPSLLPLYRGPAPIQYAIRDGQHHTGVSLIILDKEVDHGPILAQEKCLIEKIDNITSLSNKLAEISIKLLLSTINPYLDNSLSPITQDHNKATLTKMITREDGKADFSKSAIELNSERRAFTPWPGLWTTWQGKIVKFLETKPSKLNSTTPGKVELIKNDLIIHCGQGVLLINSLQLEGGKPLIVAEFLKGHKNFVSAELPS
jgi:methionyl-tRNA formyltransferase